MTDTLLDIRDLSVAFGEGERQVLAVDRVSFTIGKGETVALVGESGSGKSVTALSVMKLLPYPAAHHPSGEIMFKGQSLLTMPERDIRRVRGNDITIIFQEPMTSLNPLHTIEKQLSEVLLLHRGMTGEAARARIVSLLDQVGIPDPAGRLGSYPHQLSGGQRQRVMIAIALACGPDLLIADEPTTALDVTIQAQILALIDELVADTGMALLLISHDLAVIGRHVRRMLVMYGGSVVESGPTEAVFARLAHPYTRGLFAARPRLGAGTRGAKLATIPGRVPELADLPAGCTFSNRCPWVVDACRAALPPMVEVGAGHAARCIRVHELPATGEALTPTLSQRERG